MIIDGEPVGPKTEGMLRIMKIMEDPANVARLMRQGYVAKPEIADIVDIYGAGALLEELAKKGRSA